MGLDVTDHGRPPSVDSIARSLVSSGLPHRLRVEIARTAIASGRIGEVTEIANGLALTLLRPVINATGVLLHTNLGRAPLSLEQRSRAINVELDLRTGRRGSRQASVGRLLASACGAESALVVNNNAAAVLLVSAALAAGRAVAVSRGECVEIGGGFRIPDVLAQSGATLVDVGTTNKTRLSDYADAVARRDVDVALAMKIHPSNFRLDGLVESTPIAELATLSVPVVADIGSGLVDSRCPWLGGAPPAWLADEPAARQCLEAGAALVTFSGDKLFGGPQAGIIAGRSDLVARCVKHPLARALRPGPLVLSALQATTLAYLDHTVATTVPFWRMANCSVDSLERRAIALAEHGELFRPTAMSSLPGAGSVPGASIASFGLSAMGDHLAQLRGHTVPVVARVHDGRTWIDLRTVDPADDVFVAEALHGCG